MKFVIRYLICYIILMWACDHDSKPFAISSVNGMKTAMNGIKEIYPNFDYRKIDKLMKELVSISGEL